MADSSPRPGPGKTAPRILQDLLEYDPRRRRSAGANLLTDSAPIFRDGRTHPLRTVPQDCLHKLWRKDGQTIPPRVDEKPTTSSRYISSSSCERCLHHFDVIVDYTRRSGREEPCGPEMKFPLHHFQYLQTKRREITGKESGQDKYDAYSEIHIFVCSAPKCPAVVDIRITPPRLNKDRLAGIWDPAKVLKRGQRVIEECAGRFQKENPATPSEVLILLRTYLLDALNKAPTEPKRIAVQNKKFQLAFSDECDDLFKYLDFVPHIEPSSSGVGEGEGKFWILPNVLPLTGEFHYNRSKRDFLEDVVVELYQRLSDRPADEVKNLVGGKVYVFRPIPALKDIQGVLGCGKYERMNRLVINLDEHEHEHPHYAGLGAVGDFADELVIFAYERQHECDPKNRPYYLECLQGIAKGRESADLHEKSVMAVSLGEHTLTEVEAAYRFFAIKPDTREGDDHIIGLYESRIDSAPKQKDEARERLLIIGQARNSQKIQAVAMENPMSFEEALEFLGVVQDTPSDGVEAMAVAMASDGDKIKVARAVRVIAKQRNQYSLELFANSLESGDTSGAEVAEAYRRLQVTDTNARDETILSYYQTLCLNAAAGSRASFTDALRTIAASRNSDFLRARIDNPNAPILAEKGTEDQPVGLDNIGNTCYLNSLLQYYYTVKAVRDVVMNFSEYRMILNTENMLKKRVGGRAVGKTEIIKAQKFVEELQQLFRELKSAPTKSVKPTQDLAELTLFSTATEANFRRASINSPSGLPSIASLIEGPVYGPELPPPLHARPFPLPEKQEDDIVMVDRPSREITDRDDSSSDATLVDMETVEQNEAPVSNGIKPLNTSGNEMGTDSHTEKLSTKVQEHTEAPAEYNKDTIPPVSVTSQVNMTDQERDEVMANGTYLPPPPENLPSPNRPPPVPPRNKPAPINTSGESESLRAQKLYFGAQQDVTEVIGNVMFRLQCAIKPTNIDPKFGEQIDSIRETFFGANAVCTKIGETYNEKVEDWANIIVFPDPDGPRKLYDALDVVFDEQVVEIHKSSTTQYASIRKLPPIVQIQIQRTQFNPTTQQASKNQNRIIFEETIYLDRYMDSGRVMQRRKEAWKWKNRLRKLEARQKVLQTTPAEIPVPEALNATKDFLNMLEEEELEDISVDTTLCEALEERAAEIRQELDAITEETTNIKKRLQDQFTDMREHRYRLQAVFMHRGTSAYGHYWIYIYDFARDIWREYNDDRVSEVRDTKQIFEQDGTSGPTPYYLVYVRDNDKDDLVDAVCREIAEETAISEVQGWSGEMEDEGVVIENGVQHIENTDTIDPRSRSDLEVAGAGQWDTPNSRSEDVEW